MIRVTLHFSCGGCFEKRDVETGITSRFISVSGRSYGIGSYHTSKINPEELAPEGWVAFDPWTRCTYCPTCWAEIEAGIAQDRAQREAQP